MIHCPRHAFSVLFSAALGLQSLCGQALPPTPPTTAFTWGGDFRVRYEAYDSVQTLGSDSPTHIRDYFRFRLRAWADYQVTPELSVFGRLAAEPRYWFNAATPAGEGKEWKYALVENLSAKWATKLLDTPTNLILGRQDIQFGDQWLVSDGTPGDGSWTVFFDAARATFDFANAKTKVDVIALRQRARPDEHIAVLGRVGSLTVAEQDEKGAIVYVTNKSLPHVQLDGYFIYKGDERVVSAGNDGDLYTFGARAAGTVGTHWQYAAEAAYQTGERDLTVRRPRLITSDRDVSAYGFNSRLTYLFNDSLKNQLTFLAEYLSGDDVGTEDKDEMFDNLWARYPRIGETWAAAYAPETGGRSSQFQNLARVGATWTISPNKDSSVASTYCALFAPEATPTRATSASRFTNDGHFRGHMLQIIARQKFSKAISGLIYAEASFLGDYYTRRDTITFLRLEMTYTF